MRDPRRDVYNVLVSSAGRHTPPAGRLQRARRTRAPDSPGRPTQRAGPSRFGARCAPLVATVQRTTSRDMPRRRSTR